MIARNTLLVAGVALSTMVLAACGSTGRDSFTVGSVPEDYRTRHPIMIAEAEKTLDVPVASGARTLNEATRSNIRAFAAAYAESGTGVLHMMLPSGSPNARAASHIQNELMAAAKAGGASAGSINVYTYDATAHGSAAPVRFSYREVSASTGTCGKWNDDLANTSENRNYSEFGCASQKNLAAQIANPGDLLGPRAMTPIDAANRGAVIEDYQSGPRGGASEVTY